MKTLKRILSAALCLCLLYTALPVQTDVSADAPRRYIIECGEVWGQKTSATAFNICGGSYAMRYYNTYRNRGYNTVVTVDGERQTDPSNLIAPGLRLSVELENPGLDKTELREYHKNYIMVRYTLKNNGARPHEVQVGSCAGIAVGGKEHPPIWAETAGGNTLIASGRPNLRAVRLVATACDTVWYGEYEDRFDNCFKDKKNRSPDNVCYISPSLAYSWSVTIAPGETWSSYVLLGAGLQTDLQAATPSIPQPKIIQSAPAVSLTASEIYINEGDDMPDWEDYVAFASGTISTSGQPTKADPPGTYTVTYTAANTKGTATATLKVNVLPKSAALSQTAVTGTDNFTLSAKLEYTGGLDFTETGFVYGLVSKPTLSQNDGSVKTSSVVTDKGGALKVSLAKGSLIEGLQYYARAYAKAKDGSVIYGNSSDPFGTAVPAYGKFSVKNNGNRSFTISRTDGTDGAQTVYYRTVNGSAVGGTHFTHIANSVNFAAGESSKTISVTELGVTKTYGGNASTAYSNTDRTYQFEIYRVEGGATIATSKATRTIPKSTSYTVSKTLYNETSRTVVDNVLTSDSADKQNTWVGDHSGTGDWKIYFQNDRKKNTDQLNFHVSRSIDSPYLKATAKGFFYRAYFTYKEYDDGYHLVWMANHTPDSYGPVEITKGAIPLDSDFGKAYFTATWESASSGCYLNIPSMEGNATAKNGIEYDSSRTINNNILFDINDTAHVWFSAAGKNSDLWYIKSYMDYARVYDNVEPQVLAIAPMAGGKYFAGDSVTISLIFDEIVDSANSSLSNRSVITTNWGTFSYSGGADTNVLYFTGKVPENASSTIRLTSLNCASQIKDLSSDTGTDSSYSGTKSTTVTVGKAAAPTVTVNAVTNSNGTLSSTVRATNAVKLEYAWSTSSAIPTYGWVTSGSTSSVSVKTVRGSGKYYLHARATNSDGRTVTAYKSVTVPSSGTGAAITPDLTVTANNTAWAKTQTITVTRSPGTATVKVKTPSGTTTTLSSSATSYTATENGVYAFTLTYNGETVTRQAVVDKIDKTPPNIIINDLPDDNYTERITLKFSVTDTGSGVNTVTAKWGTANAVITDNGDGTYSTVCPDATGTHTLTVTAADKVGNSSATVKSKSYTVNLSAPTLTVTKISTTATGITYSYSVSANGNTDVTVRLPDGTETTELTGNFTLAESGVYLVAVTDAAGHFVSKEIEITAEIDGVPPDVRLYADDSAENDSMTVVVAIYEAKALSAVTKNGETFAVTDAGNGKYTASFTVTEGGVYTVTADDASGNRGTDSIIIYALKNDNTTVLKYAEEGKYGELPSLGKSGYAFGGWYTAASGGTRVESGTEIDSVYTLYAQWTHIAHYGGEATCTAKAVCEICGAEYGEIDPDNHNLIHHNAKAVTCIENGWNAYDTCSRCDYTTFEELLAPGHDYQNGLWVTDNILHRKQCANCDSTDTPENHTFGEWSGGSRVCEVCGYEELQTITVTITWGAMAFTYTDGAWDPETHSSLPGKWAADSTDGNMITVENSGNSEVDVSFIYAKSDDNSAVDGRFANEQGSDIEGFAALPVGDKKYARLLLSGKPEHSMSAETVGTVTVCLGGNT